MADEDLMGQDEIERLLNQAKQEPAPAAESKPAAAQSDALGQDEIESLIGGTETAEAPRAAAGTVAAADDDKLLGQDDIEKLLNQSASGSAKPTPQAPPPKEAAPAAPMAGEGSLPQGDVEYLLNQAERALQSIDEEANKELPAGASIFRFEEFTGVPASAENATLDLIRDVELDLKIELGRTHMYLEDVLKLRKGAVVPLDKIAGDPVDIYVNGRLIARGEVLVLNDNFCVRVAELITGTSVCA